MQAELRGLNPTDVGKMILEAFGKNINRDKWLSFLESTLDIFNLCRVVVYKSHGSYHFVTPLYNLGTASPIIIPISGAKSQDIGECVLTQINYSLTHLMLIK
jgi:hypothetical protein